MRLIDADALIQKRSHAKAYAQDMYVIGQGYVMDAPTIDAVPVVRCKNCKHYNTIGCSKGFGWCENIDRGTSDNFYCANGKQLNKESEGRLMAKYRKKPVVIEAIQWNTPDKNGKVKLARECKDHPKVRPTSYLEVSEMLGTAGCSQEQPYWDWSVMGVIDTLEGKHIVRPGDYIIKGVKGEFYPCKPDIFEMTYEKVESEDD